MMSGSPESPRPAYDLQRTEVPLRNKPSVDGESLVYSSNIDGHSDHYTEGADSSFTGMGAHTGTHQDATEIVHEMHLALLYLLSNPDEFKKALHAHPPRGTTTLSDWNAEYEEDDESVMTSATAYTALPFVVFADDAEVVLPQAHTASQLFGIERLEGIELEAAAGIPALSQLFVRWLALMPNGDHLNIIDPPGLTVMRIAGGRYRVTAAHRVIWTWNNEFAAIAEDGGILSEDSPEKPTSPSLQLGDLVSMTIVDVFETDNQGKLLSYCPTFDNRAVYKTSQASETIRKSSSKLFTMFGRTQKAVAKSGVTQKATAQMKKLGLMQHAKNVAENVKHRVDEAVHSYSSPSKNNTLESGGTGPVTDSKEFEEAMAAAEEAATAGSPTVVVPPTDHHEDEQSEESPATQDEEADGYVSGDEAGDVDRAEI